MLDKPFIRWTIRLNVRNIRWVQFTYAIQTAKRVSDAAFKVAVSRKRTNDCFSFKKHGECRRGNNCRYKHDPKYAKKKRTDDSKARENVQKPDEKRMVYLSKAEHDRLIMMREENGERQVFMGNVRDSDGSNESSVFQED